jgi:hypothetical protein
MAERERRLLTKLVRSSAQGGKQTPPHTIGIDADSAQGDYGRELDWFPPRGLQ